MDGGKPKTRISSGTPTWVRGAEILASFSGIFLDAFIGMWTGNEGACVQVEPMCVTHTEDGKLTYYAIIPAHLLLLLKGEKSILFNSQHNQR